MAWKEQNLLMADRPAQTFGFRRAPAEQLRAARAWQAQAPATRWLQIGGDAMDDCIDRSSAINLGVSNRREWWLVPAAAMVPGCAPAHCRRMEKTRQMLPPIRHDLGQPDRAR